MDSFMNSIKSAAAGTTTEGDPKKANPDQPSASELLSSAKQVAEAAKYATSNQTEKIDKAKVAGAAADIADATEKYGKFDETKGVGSYLQKAEDYLHDYEKSGATPPAPAKEEAAPPAKEEAPPAAAEEKKVEKEESGSGFGAGDALKAAGSFFK